MATIDLTAHDALILVDVQNDFLLGGALAVPLGDRVVPPLNRAIMRFRARGLPVFATRNWHPEDHCSFLSRGGPWPPHCLANQKGAEISSRLAVDPAVIVISKGLDSEVDAYSGFQGTDLAERLDVLGVRRLFIGGLATEYFVLNTAQDALARGFTVFLLLDAIAAVDVNPGDGQAAIDLMLRWGVIPTDSSLETAPSAAA